MIPPGRVLKAGTYEAAPQDARAIVSPRQRRRMAREELEAHLAAERIAEDAQRRADAILTHAQQVAKEAAQIAAREAAAGEEAKLAATYLLMRRAEETRAQDGQERTLAIAVALAERLLGAALELSPARISEVAAQVFAEARGARRAVIDAHPLDAEALTQGLAAGGFGPSEFVVRADPTLARGDLCLHTDLGTLDAKLRPRLERLVPALRDALRR